MIPLEGRVFLARHGRPDFPDRRAYLLGWTDLPLSPEGRDQARDLGTALGGIPFRRVWCSDLLRTRQTAELLGVEAQPRQELREIFLGEWDGLPVEEVAAREPEAFAARGADFAGFRPPGGESFGDLQARAVAAFEVLMEEAEEGPVLLVGHTGFFWTLVSRYADVPLDRFGRFPQGYCGVHVLRRGKAGFAPERLNWVPRIG